MAIKLVDSKWNPILAGTTKKFVMDSASEAASLPDAIPGSSALAADTGAAYIVNASGVWKETTPDALDFLELEA